MRLARRENGFTYLVLLCLIAILGIGLAAISELWATTAKRQKLAELDWMGAQFVQAIGRYHDASPGSVKFYPPNLQELLEDRRFLTIRRHLRVIYRNPFTGKPDWDPVLAPDGRLRGVSALVVAGGEAQRREYVYSPEVPPLAGGR